MRHQVSGRKLGRTTSHREAMFRNMAVSLITHGRITTTLEKAKELRKFAERLISLGKKDTLHARRVAFDRLRDRSAVQKLFATLAPAFKSRNGGYTRIFRLGHRLGDAAKVAIIEYLREDLPAAEGTAKPVKGTEKAKKAAAQPKAKKAPKTPAAESKKAAKATDTEGKTEKKAAKSTPAKSKKKAETKE